MLVIIWITSSIANFWAAVIMVVEGKAKLNQTSCHRLLGHRTGIVSLHAFTAPFAAPFSLGVHCQLLSIYLKLKL